LLSLAWSADLSLVIDTLRADRFAVDEDRRILVLRIGRIDIDTGGL
jgi:hypothetical protein